MGRKMHMIIRKANIYDSNDIARVHYDVWTDFYGDFVTKEFLEKLSYDNRKKFWMKFINDGHVVYVIEEKTGGIVAFAVPNMYKLKTVNAYGEIIAHYVAEKHQHQGYGSVLLMACAKLFHKNDIDKMRVWVHKDNPSTEFYKKMEGVEMDAKLDRLDNKDIIKLNIEWQGLEELINRHADVFDGITKEY